MTVTADFAQQYAQLPWVIYALGPGLEHLNRALGLAYLAIAQGKQVTILSNSEYAPLVRERLGVGEIRWCLIDANAPKEEALEVINHQLTASPAVLVVDALPRGLWGDLTQLLPRLRNLPRVLVLRDLPPEYVSSRQIADWIADHYDLVLVAGEGEIPEGLENLPQLKITPPWVIDSATELPTRRQVREQWQLPDLSPVAKTVLILGVGTPPENEIYAELTALLRQKMPWLQLRFLSLRYHAPCPFETWFPCFPLMEGMVGGDLAIGDGNYSTAYECCALGLPLIAFSQLRSNDRQPERITRLQAQQSDRLTPVTSIEEAYAAVVKHLGQAMQAEGLGKTQGNKNNKNNKSKDRYRRPRYPNGTETALPLIETAIAQKWEQLSQTWLNQLVINPPES